MPAKVTAAEENDLKPNIGRTLRLIYRWSCSILLFRYLLLWTLIFFNARRVLPQPVLGIAGDDRSGRFPEALQRWPHFPCRTAG